MRKIKEVLRLRFELGLGQRQIAQLRIGLRTVHDYLVRAAAAGISCACATVWAKKNWKPSCLGMRRERRELHRKRPVCPRVPPFSKTCAARRWTYFYLPGELTRKRLGPGPRKLLPEALWQDEARPSPP